MKTFVQKLSLFVAVLMFFFFTGCVKPQPLTPDKLFSIKLAEESFVLPYGEVVEGTYTVSGNVGNVSLSGTGFPDAIEIKSLGLSGDGKTGTFSLKSTLNDEKSFSGYLNFKDSKGSVAVKLTVKTLPKGKDMTVSVKSTNILLSKNGTVTLEYSTTEAKKDVEVSFKEAVPGVTLSNAFDLKTGNGVLSFGCTIQENKEFDAVLVFTDGKTTVDVAVKMSTDPGTWAVIPEAAVVVMDDDILYPAECNLPKVITFTIACESSLDEVVAEADSGVVVSMELSDDKKSGKLTVVAKPELASASVINIIAKNRAGTSKQRIFLQKAFLETNHDIITTSWEGTEEGHQYVIRVSTNLDYSITMPDRNSFIKAEKYGNDVMFTVDRNDTWEMRRYTFSITEPQGKFNVEIPVIQPSPDGNTETDLAALRALYDSLNMKEWEDTGSFGTYLSNWFTDASLDNWAGLGWATMGGVKRCWYIHLNKIQPKSTGYIPEEIGHLTRLQELQIYTGYPITHLPDAVRNLLRLDWISLSDNPIDADLADWKGLEELMNNPYRNMSFIYLDGTGIHGTFPEWAINFKDENGCLWVPHCHFSGQVPDCVVKSKMWTKEQSVCYLEVENNPRFDGSRYELVKYDEFDKTRWDYVMTYGEAMMYLQDDNYALWVGERPANTRWVDDKFGGHWEWVE